MVKALFTKVVTNVYEYEVDVDDIETFKENRYDPEIMDSFTDDTLVNINWEIYVEEVNE